MIPDFREDGYLPCGVHIASEAELTFRFGVTSEIRKRLILRVRRWVKLARATAAQRLLIDGSFVTSKKAPRDVDAVIFLANDFYHQIAAENVAAIELEQMLLTRSPEELFAAEDSRDWHEWVKFFSRTRESDSRTKGLVEVIL